MSMLRNSMPILSVGITPFRSILTFGTNESTVSMLNGRERLNHQHSNPGKAQSYLSNVGFGSSHENKSRVTTSCPETRLHDRDDTSDIEVRGCESYWGFS